MMKTLKLMAIPAALLIGVFLLGFGQAIWTMNAPAVPYASMQKMREGITMDQVRSVLGHPRSVSPHEDGTERWVYARRTWAMYKVDFDENGTVIYLEHDF